MNHSKAPVCLPALVYLCTNTQCIRLLHDPKYIHDLKYIVLCIYIVHIICFPKLSIYRYALGYITIHGTEVEVPDYHGMIFLKLWVHGHSNNIMCTHMLPLQCHYQTSLPLRGWYAAKTNSSHGHVLGTYTISPLHHSMGHNHYVLHSTYNIHNL